MPCCPNSWLPTIRHIAIDFYRTSRQPAHCARETVELLRNETPDFIKPDLWPPNSPDLNPVDYKVWEVMQERAYQKPVKNVDEMKQRLIEEWSGIQQGVIDQGIDQWRDRLNACVKAKSNLEHLL